MSRMELLRKSAAKARASEHGPPEDQSWEDFSDGQPAEIIPLLRDQHEENDRLQQLHLLKWISERLVSLEENVASTSEKMDASNRVMLKPKKVAASRTITPIDANEWATREEAARLADVSIKTISNWACAGKIQSRGFGQRRYHIDSIRNYLRTWEPQGTPSKRRRKPTPPERE